MEVQRARMLGAAGRVVGELGYGGMSVARVTGGAGVSRRTFYESFEDREDCFLTLFDDALARATQVVREAVVAAGQAGWRENVRVGLAALLRFFTDERALGSLLVVDALGGGPRILERRARALDGLTAIVDDGRDGHRDRRGRSKASDRGSVDDPSSLTAEGVVGAVLSVIHTRLLEQSAQRNGGSRTNGSSPRAGRDASEALIGLLNPLMGVIVLPYLGQVAAAEELARPVPRAHRGSTASSALAGPSADPLKDLDMRLTYRTLRVLSAIAAQPGASNRKIADTADVHDQGQISKLLGRLERLELIVNAGAGQPKGEPNAWTLTPKGAEVERALRV
jgi:AcrR family transcriptional regulator